MINQNSLSDPYLDQQLEGIKEYVSRHEQSHRRLRRLNRFFRNEIADLVTSQIPKNSSVLDLGCGDSLLLSKSAASVAIGIDIAPIELGDLVNRSGARPVLYESSIEKFELEALGIIRFRCPVRRTRTRL